MHTGPPQLNVYSDLEDDLAQKGNISFNKQDRDSALEIHRIFHTPLILKYAAIDHPRCRCSLVLNVLTCVCYNTDSEISQDK